MSTPAAATVDRSLARLREGTEVLRTGGGVTLTAAQCNALLDMIDRLRLALRSVDEPYPIDIFPDLQEKDSVFAAMREVNRYATEQFASEIARQRGVAARSYLEDGDLG